jgi:Xaa-Pro aminopeptidase
MTQQVVAGSAEQARVSAEQVRVAARLDAARSSLGGRAAALLAGPGADLLYLTGYAAHPSERLSLLVLPAAGTPGMVVPRLEAMAAAASPAASAGLVEIVAWDETDDPHGLVAQRLAGAVQRRAAPGRALVNAALWGQHVLGLQSALDGWSFGLSGEVTRDLRIVKDDDEIDLLQRAAHAADRVVAQVSAGRLVGRTEAEVSHEVQERLVAEGHDVATFAIVASGPNSASPHHHPGARVIEPGEAIVLDIGGTIGGYGSDITRTLWVTGDDPANGPDPELRTIFELVRRAHAEATAAVRPGVRCEALDALARDVIAGGGYGPAFIHRLGHGIGLEGHEEPYLVSGNDTVLRPGMAFSIEPGIYLEGRFGVRLEDIVVCGPEVPIVLNEAPRELSVVRG